MRGLQTRSFVGALGLLPRPFPVPLSHCGDQLMHALESEEKRKKEGVLENPFCRCKVAGLSE